MIRRSHARDRVKLAEPTLSSDYAEDDTGDPPVDMIVSPQHDRSKRTRATLTPGKGTSPFKPPPQAPRPRERRSLLPGLVETPGESEAICETPDDEAWLCETLHKVYPLADNRTMSLVELEDRKCDKDLAGDLMQVCSLSGRLKCTLARSMLLLPLLDSYGIESCRVWY